MLSGDYAGFPFLFLGPPLGGWGVSVFIVLAAWSLLWKGLALWHASKRDEQWWFIALLLINTVGFLEIFYLFVIAKKKPSELFGSSHISSSSGLPNRA